MADFCQFFTTFSWNSIILDQCIGREGRRPGGVGGGKKLKQRRNKTQISRVQGSYDVYLHPQRINIPLQGLDKHALTVGAISGPHRQIGALLWRHFTSRQIYIVGKMHSGKADQSTLASGGSEHA